MDVLLVEDEVLVREMLAEDLADAGLDVAEATDAETTLEAVEVVGASGRPPCVLVTDVNLGAGMDGLALVAEMRRRWPGMGGVVITGKPSDLDGRRSDPREVCLLKRFGPPRLPAMARMPVTSAAALLLLAATSAACTTSIPSGADSTDRLPTFGWAPPRMRAPSAERPAWLPSPPADAPRFPVTNDGFRAEIKARSETGA